MRPIRRLQAPGAERARRAGKPPATRAGRRGEFQARRGARSRCCPPCWSPAASRSASPPAHVARPRFICVKVRWRGLQLETPEWMQHLVQPDGGCGDGYLRVRGHGLQVAVFEEVAASPPRLVLHGGGPASEDGCHSHIRYRR